MTSFNENIAKFPQEVIEILSLKEVSELLFTVLCCDGLLRCYSL